MSCKLGRVSDRGPTTLGYFHCPVTGLVPGGPRWISANDANTISIDSEATTTVVLYVYERNALKKKKSKKNAEYLGCSFALIQVYHLGSDSSDLKFLSGPE